MAGGSPKFDLAEVKRLARDYLAGVPAADGRKAIRFTAPSRSTEAVITVLYCTAELANRKIATGILALEGANFSERKLQWSEIFDVYGLAGFEGHNWYVKFCIAVEDGGVEYVEEVSFHPLEQVMVLADGRTLPVTHEPEEKG